MAYETELYLYCVTRPSHGTAMFSFSAAFIDLTMSESDLEKPWSTLKCVTFQAGRLMAVYYLSFWDDGSMQQWQNTEDGSSV